MKHRLFRQTASVVVIIMTVVTQVSVLACFSGCLLVTASPAPSSGRSPAASPCLEHGCCCLSVLAGPAQDSSVDPVSSTGGSGSCERECSKIQSSLSCLPGDTRFVVTSFLASSVHPCDAELPPFDPADSLFRPPRVS